MNCEPPTVLNLRTVQIMFSKLYTVIPYFENSVDPDQPASDESKKDSKDQK